MRIIPYEGLAHYPHPDVFFDVAHIPLGIPEAAVIETRQGIMRRESDVAISWYLNGLLDCFPSLHATLGVSVHRNDIMNIMQVSKYVSVRRIFF